MSLATAPVVVAAGTRTRRVTWARTFLYLRPRRCREAPSPAAHKAAVHPRILPSFPAPARVGVDNSNILTTAHPTLVQRRDRLTGRLSDAFRDLILERKATFKNDGRIYSSHSFLLLVVLLL